MEDDSGWITYQPRNKKNQSKKQTIHSSSQSNSNGTKCSFSSSNGSTNNQRQPASQHTPHNAQHHGGARTQSQVISKNIPTKLSHPCDCSFGYSPHYISQEQEDYSAMFSLHIDTTLSIILSMFNAAGIVPQVPDWTPDTNESTTRNPLPYSRPAAPIHPDYAKYRIDTDELARLLPRASSPQDCFWLPKLSTAADSPSTLLALPPATLMHLLQQHPLATLLPLGHRVLTGEPKSPFAYVLLLMKGTAYTPGVLVAAHSLRMSGTRADIVAMVTPDVAADPTAIADLSVVCDMVVEVDYLQYNCTMLRTTKQKEMYAQWMDVAITKWQCLSFVEYRKVILFDADKVAFRPLDDLFAMQAPAGTFGSPWSIVGKQEVVYNAGAEDLVRTPDADADADTRTSSFADVVKQLPTQPLSPADVADPLLAPRLTRLPALPPPMASTDSGQVSLALRGVRTKKGNSNSSGNGDNGLSRVKDYYRDVLHGERVSGARVMQALQDSGTVAVGTVVLLEPNLYDYCCLLRAMVERGRGLTEHSGPVVPHPPVCAVNGFDMSDPMRTGFGFPSCYSMCDEQALAYLYVHKGVSFRMIHTRYNAIPWLPRWLVKHNANVRARIAARARATAPPAKTSECVHCNPSLDDTVYVADLHTATTDAALLPRLSPKMNTPENKNFLKEGRFRVLRSPYLFHFVNLKPWQLSPEAYADLMPWWAVARALVAELASDQASGEPRALRGDWFSADTKGEKFASECAWCTALVSVLLRGDERPSNNLLASSAPSTSVTNDTAVLLLHRHAMVTVSGEPGRPRLCTSCPLLREWVVLPHDVCSQVDPQLAY